MLEAMKLAFKTQKVCASSNLRMLLGVLERQLLQYTRNIPERRHATGSGGVLAGGVTGESGTPEARRRHAVGAPLARRRCSTRAATSAARRICSPARRMFGAATPATCCTSSCVGRWTRCGWDQG
eukprot:XP_001693674.1 predicted protein [Chlamydomonas reinhardtii]